MWKGPGASSAISSLITSPPPSPEWVERVEGCGAGGGCVCSLLRLLEYDHLDGKESEMVASLTTYHVSFRGNVGAVNDLRCALESADAGALL